MYYQCTCVYTVTVYFLGTCTTIGTCILMDYTAHHLPGSSGHFRQVRPRGSWTLDPVWHYFLHHSCQSFCTQHNNVRLVPQEVSFLRPTNQQTASYCPWFAVPWDCRPRWSQGLYEREEWVDEVVNLWQYNKVECCQIVTVFTIHWVRGFSLHLWSPATCITML